MDNTDVLKQFAQQLNSLMNTYTDLTDYVGNMIADNAKSIAYLIQPYDLMQLVDCKQKEKAILENILARGK